MTRRQGAFAASVVEEEEFETVVSDVSDMYLIETLREVIYAYDAKRINVLPENKGEVEDDE